MTKNGKFEMQRAKKVKEELLAYGADENLVNGMTRADREVYLADFKKEEDILEEQEVPRTLGRDRDEERTDDAIDNRIFPHRIAFKEDLTERDRTMVSKERFIAVIYCRKNYDYNRVDEFLDFLEVIFGDEIIIQVEAKNCSALSVIDQIKHDKESLGIREHASFYAYFGEDFLLQNDSSDNLAILSSLHDRLQSLNLLPGEIYSLSQALEEFES